MVKFHGVEILVQAEQTDAITAGGEQHHELSTLNSFQTLENVHIYHVLP